ADDQVGAAPVAVMSHALWRERFSGDPATVGRSLVLNGRSCTIVGVMPRGFVYPPRVQLWVPLVPIVGKELETSAGWMIALGRLKPGVSTEQARADTTALLVAYLSSIGVDTKGFTTVITPLSEAIFGPTRPTLLLLLGAVVLVLLMACANVAALLL